MRPVNTEIGGVFLITPPLDVVFSSFFEDVAAVRVDATRLPLLPFAGFVPSLTILLVGVTVVFVAGVFTLVVDAADVGRAYINILNEI